MGTAPSAIRDLSDAAHAEATFGLTTEFDLPNRHKLLASLSCPVVGRSGANAFVQLSETDGNRYTRQPDVFARDMAEAVRRVATLYPKAVLRPDSIEVRLRKGGRAAAAKYLPHALRAWREAYGQPVPSLDELKQQGKAKKAAKTAADNDAVALLRTGQPGVRKWNRRPLAGRVQADLRAADLRAADLTGVLFGGAALDGADLSGATLSEANFTHGPIVGSLKGTKFEGANLSGAWLPSCKCGGAVFRTADLTGATLGGADLRGADFTGATLTETDLLKAVFDEHTKWPKGFKPPAGLTWKGTGPDPRKAPTKREKKLPPPADFAGFLDRLKKATDAAKLDKAMSMLKADRFRLFAKVDADQVVGVVKSQSVESLVYSCRLGRDGKYACCTQNLNVCGGLRGSPCKHLLVLIVGLTKAGELDPATAHAWTQASRGQKPELDKEAMTETFLQYKGAEAGTVDWRPTETIPEDFYAV